jgi:tetratricopeptide (TPR) repeat protein
VETCYDDLERAWVVNFFRSARLVSARLYPCKTLSDRQAEGERAHRSETSVLSLALQLKEKLAQAKDPQAHMRLGFFFFVYQFYQEAEEELKLGLSFFPDFAEALFHLGNVCHRTGKFNQALACYERACQLDSAYPDYANALGQLFVEEGKLAEAEKAFLSALSANPNYVEARLNLAQIYLDQGGRNGNAPAFLQKTEELLRQSFSLLENETAFPSLNPTIHYDSLCRLFLDLKGKSSSRLDKSNLRAWCYLFNVAFRFGGDLLSKPQIEQYIEKLHLENRPGFADLTNFLGVAYLYYGSFFLSSAEKQAGPEASVLIKRIAAKQALILRSLDF